MIPRPSGPATSIVRYALLAAVAVWVVLTLLPRGATLIYLWPWPVVLAGSLLVPALVWGAAVATGRAERLGGANDWAAIATLLAVCAGALASPFRDASVRALLLPVAALSVVYLLVPHLRANPAATTRIARGLAELLAAVTAMSLGLWWFLTAQPYLAQVAAANAAAGAGTAASHLWEVRNPHPFGHANYVAGALLLLLPWGVHQVLVAGRAARFAWSLVVVAALFCLFTTGSRAAVIGLGVLAVAGGISLVRTGAISRRLAGVGVALALGAVAIFAAANPRVLGLLRSSSAAGPNEGDRQRAAMLHAGREMAIARPVVGWGLGTTPLVYPRFRGQLTGGVETALQLHNTPVQVLADNGAAGAIAVLWLAGCAVLAWWRTSAPEARIAGLALAGYGVFALFDYQFDVPVFALLLAVMLAFLFAAPLVAGSARFPRWASAPLAALLVAIVWYATPAAISQHHLAQAATALEAGDTAAFDRLAQRAADASRVDTTALNALAMQRGERALRAANETEQLQLARQAADFFSASLGRNQDQELCLTNLAWLRLRTEPKLATPYFRAAAKLTPDKDGLYLGLAYGFLAEGRPANAIHALALECLAHPRFLVSPQWRDPALGSLRGAVLSRLEQRAGALAEKSIEDRWSAVELGYLATLSRWLAGRAPAAEVLADAKSHEREHVFAVWDQPEQKLISGDREQLRAHYISRHLAPPDDAWLDAMQAFVALSPAEQRKRLLDPATLPPALIALSRAQRTGYGILVKNLDTPMPVDFYYVQHNRLMEDFFDFLLPSELTLPGPVLLAELESVSH